jgi:hypothetical protein
VIGAVRAERSQTLPYGMNRRMGDQDKYLNIYKKNSKLAVFWTKTYNFWTQNNRSKDYLRYHILLKRSFLGVKRVV